MKDTTTNKRNNKYAVIAGIQVFVAFLASLLVALSQEPVVVTAAAVMAVFCLITMLGWLELDKNTNRQYNAEQARRKFEKEDK